MAKTETLREALERAFLTIGDRQICQKLIMDRQKWSLTTFVKKLDQPLDATISDQLTADSERYLSGEPIQYIIGEEQFFGRWLKVTKDTLIPRPETEELVKRVLDTYQTTEPLKLVDLGTGSGCIAVTIAAERPTWSVVATDISDSALAIAKTNNERLAEGRVTFLKGSILEPLRGDRFDIIVANPPYIGRSEWLEVDDVVKRYEPEQALFADQDGLAFYQAFIDTLPLLSHYPQYIVMEIGYRQGRRLEQLCKALEKEYTVHIIKDLNQHDRMVELKRKKVDERKSMTKMTDEMTNKQTNKQTNKPKTTKLLKREDITDAARALRDGELVAFPTETVYGLGAVISNEKAVKGVYAAKGRPSDNPLIMTVSDLEMAKRYLEPLSHRAEKLIKAFWPGSLTLVCDVIPGSVSDSVTSGRSTVAVRFPDDSLTTTLIKEVGEPIVGPSANTSGKPSPTTAEHVMHDLHGKIYGVLDGGTTNVGIESTIVDVSSGSPFAILRPGNVTREMIEAVAGPLDELSVDPAAAPKAPGMKYRHYSPTKPVFTIDERVNEWQNAISLTDDRTALAVPDSLLKSLAPSVADSDRVIYQLGATTQNWQHRLYDVLRDIDDQPTIDQLLIYLPVDNSANEGYRNRLMKAAHGPFVKD